MNFVNNDIRKVEELEDGSTVYEIGGKEPAVEETSNSFSENLADNLAEEILQKISVFLLDSIDKDNEASQLWMDSIKKVKDYLGFDIEDIKNIPFKESTRTYDTTMATGLIRFYSTTRAEILPQSGPAGFRIKGNYEEERLQEQGTKVRDWLNNYLTVVDKAYYSDFERFLLHLGFNGTGFRKVYYDKLLGRPISRFIRAEDFIIDGDCASILESTRLTHVLHLSKRDIILKQQNGTFRDIELPFLKSMEISEDLGTLNQTKDKSDFDIKVYEKRSLFPIYECHVYLDLDEFTGKDENDIPLPYIINLDPTSKQILSIRRNWREDDPHKERRNYFIQYNYLPGFGVRGLGLAHLLGSNAISLTTILRELIDAGKFKNLPGGLRVKGIKQQTNDLIVGAGQFVQVDTGGVDLDKAFMPLPYSEPSQTLRELRLEVMNQTKELASTSEMGMLDSKEDIPAGTAMAFLEVKNRIQSAVLGSIHYSLTQELQLIDSIVRETMDDNFNERIGEHTITMNDFHDDIEIIPISDPVNNSSYQQMMKASAIFDIATKDPGLHDMHEVFKFYYESLKLSPDIIEKILKPPQEEAVPIDPITENMNMMLGKPVKAEIWQNQQAHILTHSVFAEQNQNNPNLVAQVMAHNNEHMALDYLIRMQQLLGQPLPPLDELRNPEIQNMIALAIANALEENGMTQAPPSEEDIKTSLVMADIKQKEEETRVRLEIARMKSEESAFKTQIEFEKEKAKIESNEDIAQLKAETDEKIELIKHGVINE